MKRLVRKRRVSRSTAGDMGVFLLLFLLCCLMITPLLFAIFSAFKPFDELLLFPPRFLVRNPTLANFTELFAVMRESWVPFSRYFFNTFFLTAVGTVGNVLLSSMAAYPLAKFQFRGRNLIFSSIVLSLMFSGAVTTVPTYLIMKQLHWIDTIWAIVMPPIQSSLGLYLMKQFMEQSIPDSLLEAARIDGCHEITIFFKIVMPLVRPAWLTLGILMVQNLWGETGGSYIYDESIKPLSVALNQLSASGISRAGVGAAASVLMMAVPILIFIIFQSNMIKTMAASGMKD